MPEHTRHILCIACYSPLCVWFSHSLSIYLSGHRCVPLCPRVLLMTPFERHWKTHRFTSWMHVCTCKHAARVVGLLKGSFAASIDRTTSSRTRSLVFPLSYDSFLYFLLLLSREEGTECLSHWLAWKLGHSWHALSFCFWCLSVCWKVSASTGGKGVVLEWLIEFLDRDCDCCLYLYFIFTSLSGAEPIDDPFFFFLN